MGAHTDRASEVSLQLADGEAEPALLDAQAAVLDAQAITSKRRLRMWRTVAVLVLVAGVTASAFGAMAVARNEVDRSHRAFATSSAEIASTLQLAIQHEQDLTVSIGGFIAGNPHATNAEFLAWSTTVKALKRYPELQGLGYSVMITAAQLPAFAAREVAAAPTHSPHGFQVVPPGKRAFYCFAVLGQVRSSLLNFPRGFDFCAASSTVASRDTGQGDYTPLKFGPLSLLAVETPIFRDGTIPPTLAARRAQFLGWVGMVLSPNEVVSRALVGHPNTAVTFGYHSTVSDASFQSGTAPGRSQRDVIDLHNGWTVTTTGAIARGDILAPGVALELLVAGLALSSVFAALIYVLATGRARAVAMVKQKTGELQHQALHDVLTGLPNRALISDRIEQLLARNRRDGTSAAALFVDLDGFKNVNDTLGHGAGDQLLQAVAARISATLREVDTIGRMGGDEFVILIDGAAERGAPELVAERLLEVMRQPFELDSAPAPMIVTASIGVAIGDRDTPGALLRDADVALYQAKAAGRNCYEVFHQAMESHAQHRYELEFDLRAALEGEQFRLVYQPIYNLDDLSIVGVEALLRWQHPTLGEIQPDDFIPLLESSGQIIDVGRWVLIEACTQMSAWRERGSELMVSVNVSGRQLDRDSVTEHVREALQVSGLDPSALTLEVTETALMRNVEATAERLRELKTLGVQIAIDDFGTGYSSLAYLQRFPVDCIKIDRSFTDAVTRSPEANTLIHTLVQLGKDLGLRTLAEGVETTDQIDKLRDEGVHEVQGFLLARPTSPERFEEELLLPERPTQPVSNVAPGSD
jgi:diguanylate cyclase (GGDEF)-like protein